MRYRPLGKTDLIVSELGFGALPIGGAATGHGYGRTCDHCSSGAIERALDLGCTFFDTADIYGNGHSEHLLGRTLEHAGVLRDVVIATKVGSVLAGDRTAQDFSSRHLRRAVIQSLRRLRRDWIDLYLLHNPSLAEIRSGRLQADLEILKQEGKVRHYGVSIHTAVEGIACMEDPRTAAIEVVYNLFSEAQTDPVSDALFPQTARYGIGVIAREPLANGFLTDRDNVHRAFGVGDFRSTLAISERQMRGRLASALRTIETPGVSLAQLALRFVLDEPSVSTTIVGIKTPAQAAENFAAVDLPPFASFYSAAHAVAVEFR